MRRSRSALAGLLCALAALLFPSVPPALAAEAQSEFHGFYLLSFDRYGRLASPYERDLAIAELRANPEVERVIVIAYGWANDGEASFSAYSSLRRILEGQPGGPDTRRTAVIGIGWDSSQTGLRKLTNDLIPLPFLADALSTVPDRLLFPLSFWSKAAMADRIGFGGLRSTLNEIFAGAYPDGTRHPQVYLVGHSFGTRILSALLADKIGGIVPVQTVPFAAREHVRGALMLQPALIAANLPQDTPFPIVVTQSEHDHANGMLFPIANLMINAYTFTAVEALVQNRVFTAVESGVDSATDAIREQTGRVLPAMRRETAPSTTQAQSEPGPIEQLPRSAYRAARRTGAELVSIPAAVAFSLTVAPAQYLYAQGNGLAQRPVDHVLDSLAQLPGIEAVVGGLGSATGRPIPWGRQSRGFFSVGALHESAGRMVLPGWLLPQDAAVYSPQSFLGEGTRADCGLPRCTGVLYVDVSDLVGRGLFGDLRKPWLNYTLGWLDLVGTHSVYDDPALGPLVSLLLPPLRDLQGAGAAPKTSLAPPGETPAPQHSSADLPTH